MRDGFAPGRGHSHQVSLQIFARARDMERYFVRTRTSCYCTLLCRAVMLSKIQFCAWPSPLLPYCSFFQMCPHIYKVSPSPVQRPTIASMPSPSQPPQPLHLAHLLLSAFSICSGFVLLIVLVLVLVLVRRYLLAQSIQCTLHLDHFPLLFMSPFTPRTYSFPFSSI